MNERIQELFNQALVEVRVSIDPATFKEYPNPNGPHTKMDFSAEKFAELIIQECAMLVEGFEITQEVALDEYVDYEASTVLKQHFGVE